MWTAAVRYLAFTAAALVGPGIAVQRLAGVRLDPALVLPLGTVLASGVYWLSLVWDAPWLFPAALLALNLTSLVRLRPWRVAAGSPGLRGAIAPSLALV